MKDPANRTIRRTTARRVAATLLPAAVSLAAAPAAPPATGGSSALLAQTPPQTQVSITGTVTSAAGQPLEGAQVTVTGTRIGALSGANGRYTISGVAPGTHQVQARRIGFAPSMQQVVVAAGQPATANFQLAPQATNLEQVVVVGYGTQRRADVTGSVASVSGEDVMTRAAPTATVSGALQGRAPGVQVVQSSGIPGGGTSVRIRGSNSITANSEPLYVVDGVPAMSGTSDRDPTQNPLNTLNPNDIESIEILKDASATAIYGARGANGVVMITTKRGERGSNQFTIESSYGVQEASRTIDVLNAQQWMTLVNEALVNGGRSAKYTAEQISSARTYDYPGMMLQTAPQQNHTATFSGGDERTRFLLSGNLVDQEGIVRRTGFERYSGRLNLDREMSDKFRLETSLSLARTRHQITDVENGGIGAGARGLLAAMVYDPSLPVRDENGNYILRAIMGEQIDNPIATVNELVSERNQTRLIGNVAGQYELTEGLTARSSVASNLWNEESPYYQPSFIAQGADTRGEAAVWTGRSTEILNENTLNYTREMRGADNLNVVGGITYQTNRFNYVRAAGQSFPVDATGYQRLQSASRLLPAESGMDEWTLLSYLGRANYNLADKYLFTLTGRYDGSSRFGANNKWAFFPSAAFAWRVSNEPFLQDGPFDDLKLRLSYGQTGNQAIDVYQSLARLDVTFAGLGTNQEQTGLAPGGTAANPDLRWETTSEFNAGADASFLDGRVSVSLDAYTKQTDDLLLQVDLPLTTGFFNQYQNVGSVRNRGLELAINTTPVQGERFTWRSNLNLATNRNEVVSLGGGRTQIFTGGDRFGGFIQGGTSHVIKPGEPLGSIIGFQTKGLFQQGDQCTLANPRPGIDCVPGEFNVVDVNGDGQINTDDRTILGRADPDFYGGFSNNVTFGRFSLDAFFNFQYGNDLVNAPNVFLQNVTGFMNERTSSLDRWTPENTDTDIPRANVNRARFIHSGLVEDGSFIRLQTLTFGYQLPEGLIPAASATRLYLTGQNLFLIDDYSGFDPEVNALSGHPAARGIDLGNYPRARIWNFGVSATF